MRRRPLSFPLSHREKLRQNAKALEALAAASGRAHPPHLAEQIAKAAAPPKRRLPRLDAPTEPLERDIQSAIMEALEIHPRCVKVIRCNSGGSMYRGKDGREHLVLFTSEPVVDLHVMLCNPAGWGWIEVKRPSWKHPTDARETRQAQFLDAVRRAGGIGAFVRSVEEALAAIQA